MPIVFALALSLAAALVPTPTLIDGRDPAVLQKQIAEMGYAPTNFEVVDGTLTATITAAADTKLTLVLGGCVKGTACTYAVLLGVYEDVHPPAPWVASANRDYDQIKVWIRDDGALAFSDGGPIDGMSRGTFKSWIDGVLVSANDLASRASKDKLIK